MIVTRNIEEGWQGDVKHKKLGVQRKTSKETSELIC